MTSRTVLLLIRLPGGAGAGAAMVRLRIEVRKEGTGMVTYSVSGP